MRFHLPKSWDCKVIFALMIGKGPGEKLKSKNKDNRLQCYRCQRRTWRCQDNGEIKTCSCKAKEN